jgi:phage terminase large subunit-like protein
MFNLDEALRNHLAQRQKEPKARFVAASVATLSPCSKPGKTRVVAAVAYVATTHEASASMTAIIQWLKEEGAHLYVTGNTLCFRPADWAQLAVVSANWRALLHELDAVDQEPENGSGR